MTPYPLTFRPVLLDKVWGGRRLEALGKRLPDPALLYGESWELADLAATSASGAGGGAVRSIIENGPLAGRSLADAAAVWGQSAFGAPADAPFPLLVKFLDAGRPLSVQVHPSPAYAAAHPGAHLKTESWYIVEASPGAELYIGLKPGVTRGRLAEALGTEDGRAVIDLLNRLPAVPGDCHTLPSGTVHALGAGVVVAEVQTPSDTTFRVYDWGRSGRELHIGPSLECAFDEHDRPTVPEAPAPRRLDPGALCGRLAATPFYSIDEIRPLEGDELTIGYRCDGRPLGGGCFVLVVLEGAVELRSIERSFEPMLLELGRTVLVPAAVALGSQLVIRERGVRVLRVTVGPA